MRKEENRVHRLQTMHTIDQQYGNMYHNLITSIYYITY